MRKKNLVSRLFFASIALFLLFSCEMEPSSSSSALTSLIKEEDSSVSHWTFLVYMAADNELESAAISDINEMENLNLPSGVNLLVLLDRSPGYDSSNGDWCGTRLYKISKDENVNKSLVSSERLSAEELELSSESETELDMGNQETLAAFLRFSRREFASEKLGLVIWGHGSGWRGFSEDETNSSSMPLPLLREGIESGLGGEKLDFLGFDTCFGSTLEVAFELKDCAEILAGTPGIVKENGWDYEQLFTEFFASEMTAADFAFACRNQFEKTYCDYQYGAFCALNLSEVENLVSVFDDFAQESASKITTSSLRNEIFSFAENDSASYFVSGTQTDFYVDILSFEKNVCEVLQDDEVSAAGKNLENALDAALLSSWNVNGGCSVSVYFGYYKSGGVFSLSHPSLYVNGSRDAGICKFVSKCDGYVPTESKAGSLLDKLFYTSF